MHFYWKMMEELKLIGETWIIKDPSLSRSYRQWMQKNHSAIDAGVCGTSPPKGPLFRYRGMALSLN